MEDENKDDIICIEVEDIIPEDDSYFKKIVGMLPRNYEYSVISSGKSRCEFVFEVESADECRDWIQAYQNEIKIDFRKMNVKKPSGSHAFKVVLKEKYRCQHNTRNNPEKHPRVSKKHTNCPWQLLIAVKRNIHGKFNAVATHINFHNHPITTSENSRYRRPAEHVVQEFNKLFIEGHTPTEALKTYSQRLHEKHPDSFTSIRSNRNLLPNLEWVIKHYVKLSKTSNDKSNGQYVFDVLQKRIQEYNKKEEETIGVFSKTNDDFVIVIQTRLMKRICEKVPSCGGILFVDSGGVTHRYGCRIFLLMTTCSIGGLPVAVFITSSDTEDVISHAITIFKDNFLNSDSFNKNGPDGPRLILTNDCDAQRNSFSKGFPQSTLLLCVYRLLQTVWRNLWNSSFEITDSDRPAVMILMKQFMCSENIEQLEEIYHSMMSSDFFQKYDAFQTYLTELFDRRAEWALCYHKTSFHVSLNTSGIFDAAMRIMKEHILDRTRAHTPVQLIDFVITDFNRYYQNKLVDVSQGRPVKYHVHHKEFRKKPFPLIISKEFTGANEFEVRNEKSDKTNIVNTEFNTCTCPEAMATTGLGKLCKHQIFVSSITKSYLHASSRDAQDAINLKKIAVDELSSLPQVRLMSETSPAGSPKISSFFSTDECVGEYVEITGMETEEAIESIEIHQTIDENDETDVIAEFEIITQEIAEKAKRNGDVLNVLKRFVDHYKQNLRTDSSLINALNNFSNYDEVRLKTSSEIREVIVVGKSARKKYGEHPYSQSSEFG